MRPGSKVLVKSDSGKDVEMEWDGTDWRSVLGEWDDTTAKASTDLIVSLKGPINEQLRPHGRELVAYLQANGGTRHGK